MTDPRFPLADRTFGAVLFDVDGTLVDSIGSVERSWIRLCVEYGIDPHRLDGFHGIPAKGVIAALFPTDQREEAFRRIEALEVADTEGIVPLPGAEQALGVLEVSGTPCALVTSGTMPLFRARLAASGLDAPAVVVTADQVREGKPSPEPYLTAAARLGVGPGDCLVVEDAVNGLRSGRAAGCATLAVGSTHPRSELEESGLADAVVGSLLDVVLVVADGRISVRPRNVREVGG